MAAPRCARSLFGPARRLQISTPRASAQAFSTSRPVRAKDEDKGVTKEVFDEQLQQLGLDPAEFRALYKSTKKAQKEAEEREPKTAAEARKQWESFQATPDHTSLLEMYKRVGIEPIKLAKYASSPPCQRPGTTHNHLSRERGIEIPGGEKPPPLNEEEQKAFSDLRIPLNIHAVNLRPLRRAPQYGIPVCDLQLRTYSIRNLMLFADFAMRAAYYMGLCAKGPIPLPRITERWTVPRANFVFKKSQENFERITMRRLIQIQDGHPDVVKAWLAFLQKHQYYGVGMKANIWEYESLDDATNVGVEVKEGDYTGRREKAMLEKVEEILASKGYKEAMKGYKAPEAKQRA
ncbi:hypothetical protein M011DRAFT_456199 [Sporormia fimetaria CBS 119925]|uniref:Small ribosomal subunit protein uS10m n=1 Tax=Sporormia fimetaria CBS 119925 TaxID=1340428 RepID=A0A6A6VJJ1_9PLEO|nr:hypothetical protein M011DRAFT_456199 [Sporormia fimetaria CBS 119925]